MSNYFEHLKLIKLGLVEKPVKEKKPIPKESKKRRKERPIYAKIVKGKIEESDGLCVLQGPTCSGMAEGGDHSQNRSPGNYINPDNIQAACNNCNFMKTVKPDLFPGHVISKYQTILAHHDSEVSATIIENGS